MSELRSKKRQIRFTHLPFQQINEGIELVHKLFKQRRGYGTVDGELPQTDTDSVGK